MCCMIYLSFEVILMSFEKKFDVNNKEKIIKKIMTISNQNNDDGYMCYNDGDSGPHYEDCL